MRKKNRFPQDPFSKREQAKYDNPIPSREYILSLLKNNAKAMNFHEIQQQLALEEDSSVALRRRLAAMRRDGQLLKDRKGRFGLVEKLDLLTGTVSAHRDGFGFLICDQGGEDLYLSVHEMRSVLPGDRVLVRLTESEGGRAEASVVEVLDREITRVVGQLTFTDGVATVWPEHRHINQKITIASDDLLEAQEGQVVLVQMRHPAQSGRRPQGEIIEILGDYKSPGLEIDAAINSYNIPCHWDSAASAEAALIPMQVRQEDKCGRVDLTALPLVTIDGEDAKDFDDAVYCQRKVQGGWRLIVAIADVSYYVKPGSALDTAARERGNSVYFPGRVVPMLPEKLANGICSLKPQVDRLCLVCELHFHESGARESYQFYEAVMHSQARLTYTEVATLLTATSPQQQEVQQPLLSPLQDLQALFQQLNQLRIARGAMEFDTRETKINFDQGRKIHSIDPVQRNIAHRIIEECMLAANTAASDYLSSRQAAVLYRNHESPNPEKLAPLRQFLTEFGLTLPGGDSPTPKQYAELLQTINSREEKMMLQTVILRSLSQAQYSPECLGHFGLAYESYAHFTSPIRRYPDLVLHRVIKSLLQPSQQPYYSEQQLVDLGDHCSYTERRADEATRDVAAWLKCEYMSDKVGDRFSGVITSVMSFGFFVELFDYYVEGLVHVRHLSDDYYTFDATKHELLGQYSRTSLRIGNVVDVLVAAVDLDSRKIDFSLIKHTKERKKNQRENKAHSKQRKRKSRSGKKKKY